MKARKLDSLEALDSFERMCAGKEQYPSASAAAAAIHVYREAGLLKRAHTLQIYQCKFGNHWHFGH